MNGHYDIIGDVHGHAEPLELLLQTLGYQNPKGCWKHNERTAIFVGDLIDRGPENLRTLEIVKKMVDNSSAQITMGNHEYNALCFHTSNGNGRFLRPHSKKNINQHKEVLDEIESKGSKSKNQWQIYLEWFRQMPLFLELEGLRVVHACWDSKSIDYLKRKLPTEPKGFKNSLSDSFLAKSVQYGTSAFKAIETILKGKEVRLPFFHPGILDRDNNRRKHIRLQWWLSQEQLQNLKTYDQVARVDGQIRKKLSGLKIPYAVKRKIRKHIRQLDNIPTFIGHYWFNGDPRLLTDTIISLDYSVARGGPLTCYRWDGESTLDKNKFVTVGNNSYNKQ
jgi:Calcineurin-like phosphoesterase